MSKFINNVNKYLSEMKIKQTYLSMTSGIDKNKLSRLLTGVQEESGTDMEKIAQGLGKNIEFFLSDFVNVPQDKEPGNSKVAFYTGNPSQEQEQIAEKLVEFVESIDEILGSKIRFINIAEGYSDGH